MLVSTTDAALDAKAHTVGNDIVVTSSDGVIKLISMTGYPQTGV